MNHCHPLLGMTVVALVSPSSGSKGNRLQVKSMFLLPDFLYLCLYTFSKY